VIARLAPGVSLDAARAEMAGITDQLVKEYPNDYKGVSAVIFPFRELLIGSRTRGPILLLMLASALVLLIACANTSNLLIARGTYRAKEFAIRTALGTTRRRLVRQLLTESVVLGAVGAVLGLGSAAVGVRALVRMAPSVIQTQNITLDPTVLTFALLCAFAAAIVFGLLPALRAGRYDVQKVLREEGRGSTSASARHVRGGLAVVQLSLALSLVLSAGLLIKSFARVMQVSPGIRPDHLLTLFISLPGAKYDDTKVVPFYEELIARVQNTAGVVSAAGTSIVPFSGGWDRITVDTGTAKIADAELPEGDRYVVSASYFQTMGIPLMRGRTFAPSDASGPPVAVVDEVFARKVAHNGNALGVRIGVPGLDSAATIVGIVGHVKHYGLDAESGGQIYVDHVQYPYRFLSLAIRTQGDPAAFTSTMRSVLRSLDPDLPMSSVKTVEAFMADRTATRRFVLALLGVFAAVALLLAAVGLYGVIAYTIAQRRREFGIRLALGASPGSLVQMVMREGGMLVGIGIVSGSALALAGGQLLRSLLFGVSPLDLSVLLGAAAFLTSVAALAAWLPARRAASADPLETLAAP
jgi:putative ABC transport system permease protein